MRGKAALEIMVRSIRILDKEFSLFIKAMYTDDTIEDEEERNMKELLKQLVELRMILKMIIAVRKTLPQRRKVKWMILEILFWNFWKRRLIAMK